MASPHITPLLLLAISSLCLPPSSSAHASKVTLSLYYETLCPYCSNFMVNYLPKIFEKGLSSIVDIELVPYGNARVGSNGSIACQHGAYECLLNTVEACAIATWPNVQEHFKFIFCVEQLVYVHKYTDWESCFQTTVADSRAVVDCYNSGYGQKAVMSRASRGRS
ncbi:GILT-like protein F37H8.5, partial [Asparagus officinalis]|uniref:GILT-like protein F37H8.5 n=1 Tax=Asparagus officinalis TaxID=4686 RepID=UPI00098E333A